MSHLFYKPPFKLFRSAKFNYDFNMDTGYTELWGETLEDDPDVAPFPVIADVEITEICRGPGGVLCPFCVPGETMIQTINGEKQIKDIRIGDIVYSYDFKKQQIVKNTVLELYNRDYDGEFIIISDGIDTIEMTPEHPVYIENIGWIYAKDVKEGMNIIKYK